MSKSLFQSHDDCDGDSDGDGDGDDYDITKYEFTQQMCEPLAKIFDVYKSK